MKIYSKAALPAAVLLGAALAGCQVNVDNRTEARLDNAADAVGAAVGDAADAAGNVADAVGDKVENAADKVGNGVDVKVDLNGGNRTEGNRAADSER